MVFKLKYFMFIADENSKCRWLYHCKEDADIRTCHVREQCDTEDIKAFMDGKRLI